MCDARQQWRWRQNQFVLLYGKVYVWLLLPSCSEAYGVRIYYAFKHLNINLKIKH